LLCRTLLYISNYVPLKFFTRNLTCGSSERPLAPRNTLLIPQH
jgi:hypothetical protein